MEKVVYIDVIFLCTFAMDLLILLAAGYICGQTTGKGRLVAGALLSSLCACAFLVIGWNRWISALLSQAMAVVLAFHPKSFRRFLSLMAAVWSASFLLGGGIALVMTATQAQFLGDSGIHRNSPWMSWQLFLWTWAAFYILLRCLRKWMILHTAQRKLYGRAEVYRGERHCEMTAFFDTGNGLRHRGKAVPIVEFSACLSLFPNETAWRILKEQEWTEEQRKEELVEEVAYSALGVESGRLLLFHADRLRLWWDGGETTIEDLWVGVSRSPFSGPYQMLTPPALIEEEIR